MIRHLDCGFAAGKPGASPWLMYGAPPVTNDLQGCSTNASGRGIGFPVIASGIGSDGGGVRCMVGFSTRLNDSGSLTSALDPLAKGMPAMTDAATTARTFLVALSAPWGSAAGPVTG